jgi:hypothetical protein
MDPLPKDSGCAVLLKPLVSKGRTNLLIETSSGTSLVMVEVLPGANLKRPEDLDLRIRGGGP